MKVLWISDGGDSADLALRAKAQVKFWIKDKSFSEVGEGLLDKVQDWKPWVRWADFILFDGNKMSDIWEQVHKIKPCFGGSTFAYKLEKDRQFGKEMFKKSGLKEFEHLKFNTIEEASTHLKSHKVKHVVKPVGKDIESHHIILSEDKNGQDAVALLHSFKDKGLKTDYLEVEERKEGIEVGVSGWFISDGKGNGDWSGDININFEHKRFAAGYPEGVGFLTGEMGTAMRYDSRLNPLFLRTLDRFKPLLAKENYRGQVDISFIVNDEGDFPLEFTPRLGYPACMIEEALQITPFMELFYQTAKGNVGFQNQTSNQWATGVVCVMPGFPSEEESFKRSYEIPLFGYKHNAKNTHLIEVKNSPQGLVTCKGIGYPAVVTGTGDSILDSKRNCYKTISQMNESRFRIPNMIYRHDIGDRVMRQEKDFERLGILTRQESIPLSILA